MIQRAKCQHLLDHEKAREFQKNIYFCFTDYAKAFHCVDHNELWKILKEMGVSDHLTYFLRTLYAGQEATVRTGYGTTDCFKAGKEVQQVYCHLAYITYMQSTLCEMWSWMNHKLESRVLGEISTTSEIQMISLRAEKGRGTKEPLDKG